ncbi:flowering time control protein FPA-like [Dorcoceras hygrometricum]|uniref:Flowering time control protein FPA-like n=1 Tax=Dorcoceras hygrometricum TaxID=472368 RepID=A0A2Z6ZTU7_9LAMI|nr:flowering time control protein FPA-like [Dorcoceras hygrometricum]
MQHQSYTTIHTTATSQFIQAITRLNYKLQIRTSIFCATINTNGVPRNLIYNLNEATKHNSQGMLNTELTAGSYNSNQQLSYIPNSTGSLNKRSSLPQLPKVVSIERETLKEFSATGIAQNKDGKRRESTAESYGEQCLGFTTEIGKSGKIFLSMGSHAK